MASWTHLYQKMIDIKGLDVSKAFISELRACNAYKETMTGIVKKLDEFNDCVVQFDCGLDYEFFEDVSKKHSPSGCDEWRLPFPVCWFDFGRFAVAAWEPSDMQHGDILFMVFAKTTAGSLMLVNHVFLDNKSGVVRNYLGNDESLESMFSRTAYRALRGVCLFMQCSNVEMIETKPSQALNKKRAKLHKIPFDSTWTLQIKPGFNSKSGSVQGSHSSPRQHLRRGHMRRLGAGYAKEMVWVRSCVVGNKASGMVHKDYRLAA